MLKFLLPLLFALPVKAALYREINLNSANTAFVAGGIDSLSVNLSIGNIMGRRLLLPPNETLYVVLASPGGSVSDGVDLVDFLVRVPNVELICIECDSMAAAIFEMTPFKRLVRENSNIMMHEMRITISAKALTGKIAKSFKQQSADFNKIFYTKMGWTRKKYETMIENSEINMNGIEMVKANLADEIIIINCSPYLQTFAYRTCE